MSDNWHLLAQLRPKPLRQLLEQAAALWQRAANGEKIPLPMVALHLVSGRELSGNVIRLELVGRNPEPLLLLHRIAPGERFPDADVAYVPLVSIEAVTITNMTQVAYLLQSDTPQLVPEGMQPTRLKIREQTVQLAERLNTIGGVALQLEIDADALSQTGAALFHLNAALEETTQTLLDILETLVGKETLSAHLRSVRFMLADSPGVRLDGTTLIIGLNLAQGHQGRLQGQLLRRAIEDLF